jgi:hypothetical protein
MVSKRIRPRPEKKIPELTSFTVMISQGIGKVWSFTFSARFLFWALLIFALYIFVSTVGMSLYLKELWNETIQSDQVKQLAYETEETKRTLYQARQRLKLLEEALSNPKGKANKRAEISKSQIPKAVQEEARSHEKALDTPGREASSEPFLTIERMTTRRSTDRFSVKFRLVKTAPGRDQLKGYLFMIAGNPTTNPSQYWPYPRKVSLNDGIPVDYKSGQAFKVRNYRIIRGRFYIGSDAKTPQLLTILAYDASGTLILNKSFSIEESE